MIRKFLLLLCMGFFLSCEREETGNKPVQLLKVFVGNIELDLSATITEGLPVDRSISLNFSMPVNQSSAANAIQLTIDGQAVKADIHFSADGRTATLVPLGALDANAVYAISISGELRGADGEPFSATQVRFRTAVADLIITSMLVGERDVTALNPITEVPLNLSLSLHFSSSIDPASLEQTVELLGPEVPALMYTWSDNNRAVKITTSAALQHLSKFQFQIGKTLVGAQGEPFAGFSKTLYTEVNNTPKLPVVSDEALLTLVQQQTFKYFWDFAHPASGMARERNTSGDLVTIGGSGFGIMALIVGMERNFITRAEGLARMEKILSFLESADRFHGVWPHWVNGNSGDVIPFSPNDNGGDLVETSFVIQGLLTFRQYLDQGDAGEKSLVERINALWQTVEWNWYTRGGQHVLYWHWSPDKAWAMNHPIHGYNEALITYFLAAAAPVHAIAPAVYHEGWAKNGDIANNRSFYNITLPVGPDYGGPLFFAHYSFLGLDPRGLSDAYASYWTQNVNHSLINHAHCVLNPKQYVGYSDENWGLTASDNQEGYSAHSPANDLGVITPTAALSSFPYTPELSMKALKFFYYTLGDRLWGAYGFFDAFNITAGWTADSYLAIDQGPIIVMIENHRTGLLWDLFMSCPEVQTGMNKLGFTR